jgi:hypothetical protein
MRSRAVVWSATLLLCGAAVGGCGTSKATGKTVLSQGRPSASVPSGPQSTPATPSPATPSGGAFGHTAGATPVGPRPPSPPYSNTAKGYAANTVSAYATSSKALLEAYTSSGGAVAFANLGKADPHWHYHVCAPDGTYTACTFDNDDGDEISVDIDPALLGKPHAATSAVIDRTEYSNTPDGVIGAFVNAWINGNSYRMLRLSDAKTVAYLRTINGGAPTGWTLTDDTVDSHGDTVVSINRIGPGDDFNLLVLGSTLGHPHAITLATMT